ncbi:serine hydrolase domain-containing protein [Streptomyces purpurascens]|uniref:serine hydrolase domain-containing protein n=1 Tax=Streptomyces purpurascens TaxID=1924 RepID=UPI001672BCAF|nr:serine hydrolase domain-containing protein [Streptomyces purpurascens]MCE7045110.1 beta-lactamase family protein [Streptomyces purpurascens]GHA12648.1 D-alanyl-D-alanine carboxypeptidase [Streptomyces purpurascens]
MKRHLRTTLTAATAVALTAALAAPALAAPPTGGHDATRRAVRAAVAEGVPGVTVTVGERDGGTWGTTAGVGDLRTGEPRSKRDHYRIGSASKTFIATVVLQLVAEGELSLDDTVEKWLPGVVRGGDHDGRGITIRQLLNLTSGVHDLLADETFQRTYMLKEGFFRHRFDRKTPRELVAMALSNQRDFEPGTSWKYSNTNYILAAMVIEKITGHPYGDAVEQRVIEPLNLTATSVPRNRITVPQPSSRAYGKLARTTSGPTYDVTEFRPSFAYSGEIISDSADLNTFFRALLRGEVLPPRQLKEMKRTVPTTKENEGYGLGLRSWELTCGTTVWGHGGDIHGSSSMAVTTGDGRHSLAVNFNGDWSGETKAVVEAEYCGDR